MKYLNLFNPFKKKRNTISDSSGSMSDKTIGPLFTKDDFENIEDIALSSLEDTDKFKDCPFRRGRGNHRKYSDGAIPHPSYINYYYLFPISKNPDGNIRNFIDIDEIVLSIHTYESINERGPDSFFELLKKLIRRMKSYGYKCYITTNASSHQQVNKQNVFIHPDLRDILDKESLDNWLDIFEHRIIITKLEKEDEKVKNEKMEEGFRKKYKIPSNKHRFTQNDIDIVDDYFLSIEDEMGLIKIPTINYDWMDDIRSKRGQLGDFSILRVRTDFHIVVEILIQNDLENDLNIKLEKIKKSILTFQNRLKKHKFESVVKSNNCEDYPLRNHMMVDAFHIKITITK